MYQNRKDALMKREGHINPYTKKWVPNIPYEAPPEQYVACWHGDPPRQALHRSWFIWRQSPTEGQRQDNVVRHYAELVGVPSGDMYKGQYGPVSAYNGNRHQILTDVFVNAVWEQIK